MTKRAYRQGDVVLIRVSTYSYDHVRKNAVKPNAKGQIVLAEGEATGHAHAFTSEVKFTGLSDGRGMLLINKPEHEASTLIEGKVLETMPGGSVRFQQTDGTIIRFAADSFTLRKQGIVPNDSFSLLRHDEHDALPLAPGGYEVVVQQTATATAAGRRPVAD